jgi:DNA-directed RNA polymerase specialized sigma24 family protein
MSHLDAAYGFAHTLTGNADDAADLTARVYELSPQTLFATLGGHSLRDRLLARCLAMFTEELRSRPVSPHTSADSQQNTLSVLLSNLPPEERAAVALVDQLGLSYASGAAVLGTSVDDFRRILRRGRGVLLDASRGLGLGPAR